MNERISRRSGRNWVIALYAIICLAGLIYTAFHKGIWTDEAFTQFVSRHDLALAAIWRERWLTDIHPAGHYLFAWLFEPLTGQNIHLARLTNLVPLGLATLGLWSISSGDAVSRERAVLLVVLLLGSALPFDYFVQFRSYYWITCAVAVAAFAMTTALSSDRLDPKVAVPLAIAGFAALTLHFLSAFFFAVGAGVFLVAFWLGGQRRWAIALAAILAIGCAAMLVQVAVQAPALAFYRVNFWATTSTAQAVTALGSAIVLTVGSSMVAWLFVGTQWRHVTPDARRAMTVCLVAVAAIGVAALVVNAIRPSLVRQYLAPLVPFLLVGVSFAAAPLLSRKWWLAAVLAVGVGIVAFYTVSRSRVQDQDALASIIGARFAACPGRVVGLTPRQGGALQINEATTDAFYRSDYGNLADRFGFRLGEPFDPRCPTILWGETFTPALPLAAIAERAGLALTPAQAQAARKHTSGTGFLFVIPPDLRSAPTR